MRVRALFAASALVLFCTAAGCKREERAFRVDPPKAEIINTKPRSFRHERDKCSLRTILIRATRIPIGATRLPDIASRQQVTRGSSTCVYWLAQLLGQSLGHY